MHRFLLLWQPVLKEFFVALVLQNFRDVVQFTETLTSCESFSPIQGLVKIMSPTLPSWSSFCCILSIFHGLRLIRFPSFHESCLQWYSSVCLLLRGSLHDLWKRCELRMALDAPQLDSFDRLAHVLLLFGDFVSDFRHTFVVAINQLLGYFTFKEGWVMACGEVFFSLHDHVLRCIQLNWDAIVALGDHGSLLGLFLGSANNNLSRRRILLLILRYGYLRSLLGLRIHHLISLELLLILFWCRLKLFIISNHVSWFCPFLLNGRGWPAGH